MIVNSFSPGLLLAKSTAGPAVLDTIISAVPLRTEITLITFAQSTLTTGLLDLFHAQGGAVNTATDLIMRLTTGPTSPGVIFQAQGPGTGIMLSKGDSFAVRRVGPDISLVHVYGVTETLAETVRGTR